MEPNSLTAELKTQLEVRTRELAETRKALAEALEQQTATSESSVSATEWVVSDRS
jgi:hypothetical protein